MSLFLRLLRALSLLLCLSSASTMFAQLKTRTALPSEAPAVCPIKMTRLDIRNNKLYYTYRNTSERDIQGILFGAAYYDAVQEPHRVIVLGGERGLKMGKTRDSGLSIKYWRNTNYSGWTIWPSKILYRDGSTWQMGKEMNSCGVERWLDKQLHPPYNPARILAPPSNIIPQQQR